MVCLAAAILQSLTVTDSTLSLQPELGHTSDQASFCYHTAHTAHTNDIAVSGKLPRTVFRAIQTNCENTTHFSHL
jgi:hypothetical protein